MIQSSYRIYITGHFEIIGQCFLSFHCRKLGKTSIRFVDEEVAHLTKTKVPQKRDFVYGWVSKYREINFPTQY